MPRSSPTSSAGDPLELEITSLEWQRIQLIIRLRPPGTHDAGLDLASVRLARLDDAGEPMAPTRIWREPDAIVVRFNVMQGPGQVPLDRGRWVLVGSTGGDSPPEPLAVRAAAGLDVDAEARFFDLRRGRYGVAPSIDATSRELRVVVTLPEPPARMLDRPARRLRRLLRPFRGVRLFQLVVRLVRLSATLRIIAPRTGRRILFASDSRPSLGGNLKIVHDRMIERGLHREYRLTTLFKPSIRIRRALGDRIRLAWSMARADIIVIDDYHPVIYRIDDPDTRIVQLWHAVGTFKTVGYSRVGKPGAPDPWGRVHKNYTYAIVSAEHDVPFYAEAFGIPEDRVRPTGIPRIDRFFDPDARAAALAAALTAFPEARDRMTILFAPTFRGHGARSATYDLGRVDYAALHAVCVERDAVCLIRMHPFVQAPLGIPEAFRDRILDASHPSLDVNDLLFAVDLLITDYSSVVYEFSTLGRPMLFYAYDLEEYIASRDFYEPYESFVPGRIVRTFEEVVDAIRHDAYEVEKVAPFAARHFDHHDQGSTDRVIDLIIHG